MIEWLLQVEAMSPLVLHAERATAQFARTLAYIPGSSVRGALAEVYLKTKPQDMDFGRLFLQEGCLFSNLYPCGEDKQSVPLPVTARVCKRYRMKHPGSLSDALLPTHFQAEVVRKEWEVCPECKNARDRFEGFRTNHGPWRVVKPHQRTMAGTSILRATQTVASGQLFSHTTIEEGTRFSGYLRLADQALADSLRATLHAAPLRVGYGRTRGLGILKIVDLDESPTTNMPDLADRLGRFNAAIRQMAGQVTADRYVVLTLESDTLLRDDLLRPVTTITDGRTLGLEGVTLVRAFVVPAMAQGWNAVLGMPKHDAPALGRGSVFLFKLNEATTEAQLAAMEASGIGERRAEGFGRVRVCDPFHYELFLGGL